MRKNYIESKVNYSEIILSKIEWLACQMMCVRVCEVSALSPSLVYGDGVCVARLPLCCRELNNFMLFTVISINCYSFVLKFNVPHRLTSVHRFAERMKREKDGTKSRKKNRWQFRIHQQNICRDADKRHITNVWMYVVHRCVCVCMKLSQEIRPFEKSITKFSFFSP